MKSPISLALILGAGLCWSAGAFEPALTIPLDGGEWTYAAEHGKTAGSTAQVVTEDATPVLKIHYVFDEISEDSSEHPDYKGRDTFWLTRTGNWDLSGFSCGEFTYAGDGTSHNFALLVADTEGRQAIYKIFTWHDPARRTYSFALNAPCDGWPSNPDWSKIAKIGILVDEGGESRYRHNAGDVAVYGITFSNADRIASIAADLALVERSGAPGRDAGLAGRLDALRADLGAGKGELTDLKQRAIQLKYDALFGADPAPFAVWRQSVWRKVRPDFARFNTGAEPAGPLQLNGARGEYESVQFAVIASPQGAADLQASIGSPLTNAAGVALPESSLEIRVPDFVTTTPTSMTWYESVGPEPDIMMPNHPFAVAGGAVQPVWVTVAIPRDAAPGHYRGTVAVGNAAHRVELPLELEVFDFTLPETSSVARQFIYWLPAVANWYGYANTGDACGYNQDGYGIPLELVKRHLDFLLRYPIELVNLGWVFATETGDPAWPLTVNPDGTLNFDRFDELMEFCRARGMRKFAMGDFGRKVGRIEDPGYREKVKKVMLPFIAHLKEKGWFADGNFKVLDEPDNPALYKEIEGECRFIHEELDPAIPTLAAIGFPDPGLEKLVNIWLLRPNNWTDAFAADLRAAGAEASWYWCICPYARPLPNYFINYPATDPRVIEWMHYTHKAKNFLMWAVNNWNKNFRQPGEPRWPEVPWNPNVFGNFNGDGLFVYPGPGGDLIASMRLEELRDGAEELEYFVLLEQLLDQLEAAGGNPDTVKQGRELLKLPMMRTIYDFDADIARMDAVRREAATLIVAAQRELAERKK